MGAGRKTETVIVDEGSKSSALTMNSRVSSRNLYKDDLGGVIFGCKHNTMKECLSNQIFDEWWRNFGIDDLELQNLAIRILSQTCSSSGCERNWSVFERIHTKRRNKLEHKRLNDLVYTHYNLRLKERQSSRKSLTDPISLENIDLTDDWVVEAEDDDAPLLDVDEIDDWMDVADAILDEGEGGAAAGLPGSHMSYVKNIYPGLPLFLFNYSDRTLHGIYEAASYGQMNINPYGWSADGSDETQFPAQVRVRVREHCHPLSEDQFKGVMDENFYTPKHFWFELDHHQVKGLLAIFRSTTVAGFGKAVVNQAVNQGGSKTHPKSQAAWGSRKRLLLSDLINFEGLDRKKKLIRGNKCGILASNNQGEDECCNSSKGKKAKKN